MSNQQCEVEAEKVSMKIRSDLQDLVDVAEQIAGRTEGTFNSVCRDELPSDVTPAAEMLEESYPPLFSEMRAYLQQIRWSLNRINNVLSRSEV